MQLTRLTAYGVLRDYCRTRPWLCGCQPQPRPLPSKSGTHNAARCAPAPAERSPRHCPERSDERAPPIFVNCVRAAGRQQAGAGCCRAAVLQLRDRTI
jgi:hypothetical protein